MNRPTFLSAGAFTGSALLLLASLALNIPGMAVAQTTETEIPTRQVPPSPPPQDREPAWIVIAGHNGVGGGRSTGKYVMYNPRTGESYSTDNWHSSWERMKFIPDPTKKKRYQLLPASNGK